MNQFLDNLKRLSLAESAVYGRDPALWVREHPNAEDDARMLVDADYHMVRLYRERLAAMRNKDLVRD